MNICKGDIVQVITGATKDHGKRGKILAVFPKTSRVLVEGVNLCKRHTKPSSANQHGGIIEKEAPVHMTNVMPWCETAERPSPIIRKRLDDGTRVRVYKINGETVKDNK
jgi:large subunit ribosomal protein L24